jgi:hypothetical protein
MQSGASLLALSLEDVMSQPLRLSLWEVGLDFGLGSAVNFGIQALLFPTFTLSRGLGFTGLLFLLALARRYGLRRGFNWLVQQGQQQSWPMSLVEAVTDTCCAMAIACGLLAFWYPDESLPRVGGFIGTAYILTPLWRFMLRRLFEWLPDTGLGWKRPDKTSTT